MLSILSQANLPLGFLVLAIAAVSVSSAFPEHRHHHTRANQEYRVSHLYSIDCSSIL